MYSDSVTLTCCGVGDELSVTLIVTFVTPAAVVVPAIVAPFTLKPLGSGDAVQVKGATPPLRASVWLYAVPATPFVKEVVVIFSAGWIVSERVTLTCCAVGDELSVTLIVTFVGPAVVGVPLITPVEVFTVKPAGSGEADHV